MFGHYPTLEKTLGNVLAQANGGPQDDERYGVWMDEFTDLVDDEDYFDAASGNGPNPPFAEVLKCHVPVCQIPLDPDRREVLTDQHEKTKKRIRRDKKDNTYTETAEMEAKLSEDPNNYAPLGQGQQTLTVNQAAWNMFRPGYTVVFYGPRRSGKSKAIKNLCQRMRPFFPNVLVFTMTKASGEYFSYVPYHRVIEGLDEDLLEKVIEHQMRLKEAMSRGEDMGNTNLLIIIDDCMAEGLRYKKTFNRLFYNGRHSNITLIVAVQDVRGIAPSATINCDIACSFSLPDHRGRDTVREKFVDYLTRDEFDALYDHPQINQKYHIVMFDVAHRYNPLDKRISVGCVDEEAEEPFVMGDRDMWLETAASKKQLIDLGFEYLLDVEDWDLVKPRHADVKGKRFDKTKSARK